LLFDGVGSQFLVLLAVIMARLMVAGVVVVRLGASFVFVVGLVGE